jgi:C4-dicarboxylate transporter, DctM subunit
MRVDGGFLCHFPEKEPSQTGKASWRKRGRSLIHAFWALLMTFLILFGIIGGLFTPTEASVIAVLYAFLIGTFFYNPYMEKHPQL